ncbi:MAG: Rpn family recombination-promoting nuclease/putative transposase [Alphaproteobacteria bacterium]|nr:Rpn family recombination-promoting nuclease/putative transposase [Alphaproteobacteria bacterium]MCB9798031.1 Rpn family recombination-promoting nuclease/putative transposase [Alphaproteobacteria bacterium]
MSSPHDRLVKSVLGEPRYAAQLLERFLPPEVLSWLDLAPLARVDRSFVDEALSERHADLLFSASLRGGEPALVYLLFEHQSTPDPLMPFRLLSYMLRIWERWRAENPGARELPPIYPLVLYHGVAPWSAPLDLRALIQLPEGARPAFAQALPELRCALLDLSAVPEETLTDGALMALVLLLLKHHARGDLVEHLARWRETLWRAAQEGGLGAVAIVANYTVIVNTRPDTLPRLARLTGEVLGDAAEEHVMTAGELLIEQGRIQGHREGEARGRQAEARRLILRMLRIKFGQLPPEVETRVAEAELEAIEAWTERLFSASRPEEVVA